MTDLRLEAELVDQARLQITDPNAEVHRRMGVVTAVSVSAGTCSVTLAGSATVVTDVRYMRDALPQVNDVVWLLEVSGDYLAIGTQATTNNSAGVWTPTLYNTWSNGNGVASGVYQVVGGWCFIHGSIAFGSTSSAGGGAQMGISGLPFSVRSTLGGQGVSIPIYTRPAGTTEYMGVWRVGPGQVAGGGNTHSEFAAPGTVFLSAASNTVPATWTTSGYIEIDGAYPI